MQDTSRDALPVDADDGFNGRWMTYSELAQLRGIDKQSAARLTFRRRWRRQKDNHGTVRVLVPREWQEPSQDASRDVSGDASRDVSRDMSRDIRPLEDVAAVLREQILWANQQAEEANKRADVAVALADRTLVQLADATARVTEAEKALVGERHRADQAEVAVDRLETELEAAKIAQAEAEADSAEVRQAEAERRGKNRWARLRAAWLGE